MPDLNKEPTGNKKQYSFEDLVAATMKLVDSDHIGHILPKDKAQSLAKMLAKNAMHDIEHSKKHKKGLPND